MNAYLQDLFLIAALFINTAFSPLEAHHPFNFPGNKFTPMIVAAILTLFTRPTEEQNDLYKTVAFLNLIITIVNIAVLIFNYAIFK